MQVQRDTSNPPGPRTGRRWGPQQHRWTPQHWIWARGWSEVVASEVPVLARSAREAGGVVHTPRLACHVPAPLPKPFAVLLLLVLSSTLTLPKYSSRVPHAAGARVGRSLHETNSGEQRPKRPAWPQRRHKDIVCLPVSGGSPGQTAAVAAVRTRGAGTLAEGGVADESDATSRKRRPELRWPSSIVVIIHSTWSPPCGTRAAGPRLAPCIGPPCCPAAAYEHNGHPRTPRCAPLACPPPPTPLQLLPHRHPLPTPHRPHHQPPITLPPLRAAPTQAPPF